MKLELINQVRQKYGITPRETVFFHKDEMEEIVQKVTGSSQNWTKNTSYMQDYLDSYGWSRQKTTDSHPTTTNLRWLLNFRKTRKKTKTTSTKFVKPGLTLQYVLSKISKDLTSKMKSVSVSEGTVTLTF